MNTQPREKPYKPKTAVITIKGSRRIRVDCTRGPEGSVKVQMVATAITIITAGLASLAEIAAWPMMIPATTPAVCPTCPGRRKPASIINSMMNIWIRISRNTGKGTSLRDCPRETTRLVGNNSGSKLANAIYNAGRETARKKAR